MSKNPSDTQVSYCKSGLGGGMTSEEEAVLRKWGFKADVAYVPVSTEEQIKSALDAMGMERDRAYMAVPRCAECRWFFRWWKGTANTESGEQEWEDFGGCALASSGENRADHQRRYIKEHGQELPGDERDLPRACGNGYEVDGAYLLVPENHGCVLWQVAHEHHWRDTTTHDQTDLHYMCDVEGCGATKQEERDDR